MKKVNIKYNPYKLKTEITIDGNKLKENSNLLNDLRLQEWIEELPGILKEECNDNEFNITFHGTLMDFEDLTSVINEINSQREISIKCEHKPAKETTDKERLIDDVFKQIQEGPFDELRDEQIINAFELAKSEDFEVCVVATMSAGKSTLINSMIGSKLMPSKQEACTATITRIKDISDDNIPFRADVYDKENSKFESHEKLSLPIMERLNSDKNVSVIEVFGNIPFVSSEDISLILIDTPGPNSARNERHKKVQSELLGKSSKALVLYIMTGEFGTDDDNTLLKRVADSMAVGGKQSKDRFIFVVNKLDGRNPEDGDTNQTLEHIRSYLRTHGIKNPNLFPASVLHALNIRTIIKGGEIHENSKDDTLTKVKILNRNETLHFETYASLPASIRGEINGQLDTVRSEYKGSENENQKEALIHTGIIYIEAAIRQYVEKYAKTAKIKNIVDTFMHKLDELSCIENVKKELARNIYEREEIVKLIDSIKDKINNAKEASNFKEAVSNAVSKVNSDSKEAVESIIKKFQERILKRFDDLSGEKLSIKDADEEMEKFEKYAKKIEPDFEADLDDLIRNNLKNTSKALLENYKDKLVSLSEELDTKNLTGVTIDPLKLMSGSITYKASSTKKLVKKETEEIEDGEEWVKNVDKKWYKPWTWFDEDGYYRKKIKTIEKEYVNGMELAQLFIRPIEQSLSDNGDSAIKYAKTQAKRITDFFNKEFERLDDLLKYKLDEIKSYGTDKNKAEERIKETELKLKWLEQIKSKVESILEI